MTYLESRELIRRLKEGSPIEAEGDVVRLPRFTEIKEAEPEDFGVRAQDELIVAKARTATWCLWPINRRARFQAKDGDKFLKILDGVQEEHPDKPVKGWVLTTGPVCDETRSRLNESGHRINRIQG
jgi:hypothetical protein